MQHNGPGSGQQGTGLTPETARGLIQMLVMGAAENRVRIDVPAGVAIFVVKGKEDEKHVVTVNGDNLRIMLETMLETLVENYLDYEKLIREQLRDRMHKDLGIEQPRGPEKFGG